MAALKNVTDESFQRDVLDNDKPVLVDFWATWCAPCKMIAPILEQIALDHGDQVEIVKLDVDANPRIAAEYGVIQIPLLNVYVKGQVVKSIRGAKPKRALLKDLQEFIEA